MKQAALNLKKTGKPVFFEQMDQLVPWAALVDLITPYGPESKTGRPPWSRPPPTTNKDKTRDCDPAMHSSKKANQWYFGMKALHIGADAGADYGLVYTVRGASGHVSNVAQANTGLHGQERVAFGDPGYKGVEKRPDARAELTWHVAMRPGKRKALRLENPLDAITNKIENAKPVSKPKLSAPL